MPKYKCIGCGEIHDDNDYSKSDGDILITENCKKKKVKIIITQQMCDELNATLDKCFTKEQQEFLSIKKYKPHKVEALYG